MQASQKFELRKIRTVGEVIQDTFVFMRLNARSFFLTIALVTGPFVLLEVFCDFFVALRNTSEFRNFPMYIHTGSGNTSYLVMNMVIDFLPFLALIVSVHGYIKIYSSGREASFNEVAKFFLPDSLKVLSIFFSYIIITPLFFIPAIMIRMAPALMEYLYVIMPVLAALSIFLFIYINTRLVLIFPISIFESKVFFSAMGRSLFYTRGLVMHTFAVLFLLGVIAFPLSVVSTYGYKLFWPPLSAPYILKLAILMAQLASCLIFITGICIHYFNIVERKVHTGANHHISNIGKTNWNNSKAIDESKN